MTLDGLSGFIEARDGTKIFYQLWEAVETRAWAVGLHGLGAHSGWYEALAGRLLRRGISTAAADARGHGLTRWPLGRLPSPRLAREDALEVSKAVREKAGSVPVIGMGTSLGGAVLLSALARGDSGLRGGVLLSPALKQRFIGKGEMLGMGLGLLFGGRVGFPTPLGRGLTLTTDARRQHELERDRLSLRELPSLAWLQARRIMSEARRAVGRTRVPLLVVQARDDEVIDGRENAELLEGREGVTWIWWDGAHDVKLSAALDDLAEAILHWVEGL